ncbi:MAG TPA: glycosyl hydrolase, partial [Deltaproteobacteria bacterium]|nr:glycosyl hydrolase [Deltaproteobacteria bacterium]
MSTTHPSGSPTPCRQRPSVAWALKMFITLPMVLVWILATTACLNKRPPARLSQSVPVAAALVFDAEEDRAVGTVPKALQDAIGLQLQERNLVPEFVGVESFGEDFARRRASRHRFAWLGDRPDTAELLLLVETRATFYSQMGGRYRWTVSVRATVGRPEAADLSVDVAFEVPVFLQFAHEQAPAALQAASAIIVRRLDRLVDTALGDPEAPWELEDLGQEPSGQAPLEARPEANRQASPDRATTEGGLGLMYFVLVDRFHNGEEANDEDTDLDDPQAFHGGDIRGVIDRLDYLQSLGVQTVWLSPITDTSTEKVDGHGAFHGYWVEDPGAVEPRFGTESDLVELSEQLRSRGMKLVLDVVTNHVAYDAPLVAEKPHWFHDLGDIVDWDDPVQAVSHDVHGLPDLAQENDEVYSWLVANGRSWIDRVRPDGFRLDAVRHVPLEFWSRYNAALRETAGADFVLLGEMFDGSPAVLSKVWNEGAFGALFDFPMHYALVDVFCRDAHPGKLAAVLDADRRYAHPQRLVTFADNHDLPRVMSACGGDEQRVQRLLAFQLTTRGTPCLTYGVEVGLEGEAEPVNRGDMVFPERDDPSSTAQLIADLARIRREHPALSKGRTRLLALDDELFAYVRVADAGAVLVVINQGDTER